MYTLTVRPYIPSPMRCYKCQKFGHTSQRCDGPSICGDCGKEQHDGLECSPPPKCVNCSGEHAPRSRQCPKYKQEKVIQEIKVINKLSYPEARRKFREMAPPEFSASFAERAKRIEITPHTFSGQPRQGKIAASKVNKEISSTTAALRIPKAPIPQVIQKEQSDKDYQQLESKRKASQTKIEGKPSSTRRGTKCSPTRARKQSSSPPLKVSASAENSGKPRRPLTCPNIGKGKSPSPNELLCRESASKPSSREPSPPEIPLRSESMEVDGTSSQKSDDGWIKVGGKKKECLHS